MIITLNSALIEENNIRERNLSSTLQQAVNDFRENRNSNKYFEISFIPMSKLKNTGLVGILSEAYTSHKKVSLYAHDFWVVLISEIAKYVKQNPEVFRSLFTDSKDKVEISVPSGSITEMPMDTLTNALSNAVKFDSSILLPYFSTNTPIITEMFQALFCDLSSTYYNYSMYCCGIPAIKLMGTEQDWLELQSNYTKVTELLRPLDSVLSVYFTQVNNILSNICNSFSYDNIDFWKDIFTCENVGSGGDLTIDGWIKDLFVTKHKYTKIDNFCAAHAIVEYTCLTTKQKFKAIYGGFDYTKSEDGFIALDYSKYIFRLRDTTVEPFIPFENIVNETRNKYYKVPIEQRPKHEDILAEAIQIMKDSFK